MWNTGSLREKKCKAGGHLHLSLKAPQLKKHPPRSCSMYKHFSDWLKNLVTGSEWYLVTRSGAMVVMETKKSNPPSPAHIPDHNHHLKKKKQNPACHHRCLENMLASVRFPPASVETWDRACQIKVILPQQPKMQSPRFHNYILLQIRKEKKNLKARVSTRASLAFAAPELCKERRKRYLSP